MDKRANLKKLADFVYNNVGDEKFNMEGYFHLSSNYDIDDDEFILPHLEEINKEMYEACGTTACFLGYGPLAGIETPKKNSEKNRFKEWGEYGDFFIDDVGKSFEEIADLWEFMFTSDWSVFDNTPKGAALRAYYYLMTGNILETSDESTKEYFSREAELVAWAKSNG